MSRVWRPYERRRGRALEEPEVQSLTYYGGGSRRLTTGLGKRLGRETKELHEPCEILVNNITNIH